MSKAVSQRSRRTHFNKPLVEESLRFLPAALQHPTSVAFRTHLVEVLPQSSEKTRQRFAQYIAQRYSHDGQMNLELAAALDKFGDSRTSREILYFELLQASPLLHDIASLWLAEQPPEGGARQSLLAFLERRLGGRSAGDVATEAVAAFRGCRKITFPKATTYVPVWSGPPLEAFLYVLARLYPERAMVRVDQFAGQPIVRALLWPRSAVVPLLEEAKRAGHISKISELDQYHQFTLDGSSSERMSRLLGSLLPASPDESSVSEPLLPYGEAPDTDDEAPQPRPPKRASRSKKAAPARTSTADVPSAQLPLIPKED